MAENSKIQWTHHTFNPWRGCTKISPGCTHCYADTLSKRNPAVLGVWGDKGTRVIASELQWKEPLKWDRAAKAAGQRHRVFCASLADVFEDWGGHMLDSRGAELLANTWLPSLGRGAGDRLTMSHVRERLADLIRGTPNLDWLLLTKRPENVPHFSEDHMFGVTADGSFFPPNVWLGVSVEDQQRADERIPLLLRIPAAVRFLSVEPLLGPVDLSRIPGDAGYEVDPLRGRAKGLITRDFYPTPRVNWIIVGGESGGDSRPCQVEWVRSIVRQCKAAGTACFVKQLGARPVGGENDCMMEPTGRLRRDAKGNLTQIEFRSTIRDPKGGDPEEWPEDLRVRCFPNV